jgi:hypothetical protein
MCAAVFGDGEPMTRIKPTDELATTLATLSMFQGNVQHADDKARTVVAIQTMLMATVAAQFTLLVNSGVAHTILLAVLAVFVLGYAQSSIHLLRALIPRMAPASMHNPFAFPSVATGPGSATPQLVQEQCVHAHEVSHRLAQLAMLKHQHVRRAMYGTGALVVSTLGSLVLLVVT